MCAAHSRKQRRNEPRRRFWETQRKGGRDKGEKERKRGEERRVVEKRSQREREFLCRVCLFFTFVPGTNPFLFIFAPPTLASLLFLVTSTGCLCSRRAKSRREPCNSNCTRPLPLCRLHPPHLPLYPNSAPLPETCLSRSHQNRLFLVDPYLTVDYLIKFRTISPTGDEKQVRK